MKDGGPAFPTTRYEQVDTGGVRNDVPVPVEYPGMSLRDYFAAAALPSVTRGGRRYEDIAGDAYMIADAMLAAREAT
jgi:hypothetical protein